MKFRTFRAIPASLAALALAGTASAATITVTPSSAPNQFGSPSYDAYAQNALAALEAGSPTFGGSRATDPTAYEAAPAVIPSGDAIVTGFTSWRGDADVAGTPFENERGNRVLFGLSIVSATPFSFEDVGSSATSTDGSLDYSFPDFAVSPTFTFDELNAVGIFYGDDGVKSGDDVRYSGSEPITNPINEAYYVGDGSALAPDDSSVNDGSSNAEQQTQINLQNNVYAESQPYFFTGTYTLGSDSGSGTVQILAAPMPVPEPLAALGMLGLLGLGVTRRAKCVD